MFLVQGWWAPELNTANQAAHPGHSSVLTPSHTVPLKCREAASHKSGDGLGSLNLPFLLKVSQTFHRVPSHHLQPKGRSQHTTRKVHSGTVGAHPPRQALATGHTGQWAQDRANLHSHIRAHTCSLQPGLISQVPAQVAARWQGR